MLPLHSRMPVEHVLMARERQMPMRRRRTSEREQLDLFRALPGDLAPRDAQDLMAYPFFSLAKSKRTVPIDFRAGKIIIRVEAVPEHGMATGRRCSDLGCFADR
jgi:plasmid replication initiation protein